MGVWGKAIGFLTGNAGGKILDIADDVIDTQSERRQDDASDLSNARAMQSGSYAGDLIGLYKVNTSPLLGLVILFLIMINVLTDAVARLVRPWVTIHLIGAFFGYWELSIVELTPFQESMVFLVFTFWFGGRAIIKDIPTFLNALRKARKK